MATTSISLGPRRCRALAGVSSEFLSGGNSAYSSNKVLDDEDTDIPSAHGFLIGTTVLGGENDIISVQYQEEDKKLSQLEVKPHGTGEIWELAPHPKEKIVVACWVSNTEGRGMSISQGDAIISNIEGSEGARSATFEQKTGGQRLASVHEDGSVKIWSLRQGELGLNLDVAIGSGDYVKGAKDIAWDPNQPGVVITANGGNFARIIDSREKREVTQIDTFTRCLTVDANPNRPHVYLTSGEDGIIKFWDARKPDETVQALRDGHQHWVTKARYNPFHDQLVISSSTCGAVCLWRATSVSSAPLLDFESDEEDEARMENKKQHQDALVKTFDDNMDSVYGLSWSAVNAWIFASLSYDGKVVIHTVPSGEKYKILL